MNLQTYNLPKYPFDIEKYYWKLTKSHYGIFFIEIKGYLHSNEVNILLFFLKEELQSLYDSSYYIIDLLELSLDENYILNLNDSSFDKYIFIGDVVNIKAKHIFNDTIESINYCSSLMQKKYFDGKIRIYDYKNDVPKILEYNDHVYSWNFETKYDEKSKLGYFKLIGTYPVSFRNLDDDILETKRFYSTLNKFLKFSEVRHVIIDITDFKYQYLDKYLQDFIPTYQDFDSNPAKVSYIINEDTDTTYGFIKNSNLFFSLDEALETLKIG
ncbi:hypothetical protein [Chryseobacterium hagamense]|uniref:Uncharacterized protein n=1 Tax=Chryseobacterium hagamense TaxID=395935 RepID=A0A511YR89_9FLAO|nr:hypothetical protein [Chryseobacterium hagamense]GEN77699.1 hypothetical protein CHA01nite_34390 [Chryseobacterium hagamense]